MQRQLLKRSQNRINKSEASFVSTESLALISNLFWTKYNDDCSCSVVQMERWSVFLRIRDDQTHTAHCTQHTTIHHSGFNNSKFYNGKYTHTISRGEKDTHTDGRTDTHTDTTVAIWNSVEFRCTSFEVLQQENPGIFRRLLPASFPQGF